MLLKMSRFFETQSLFSVYSLIFVENIMKRLMAIREDYQLVGAILTQETAVAVTPILEISPQPLIKTNRTVFFDPTSEKSLIKPPRLKPSQPSRLQPSDENELNSFRL